MKRDSLMATERMMRGRSHFPLAERGRSVAVQCVAALLTGHPLTPGVSQDERKIAARALAALLLLVSLLVGVTAKAGSTITDAEMQRVIAAEEARIQAVQKVYGSVVSVFAMSRQGGGSGVVFLPDGYALTNFHVVQPVGLKGLGGLAEGELYEWDLVGIDPGGDLAIVKLKGKDEFPYATIGDSTEVHVGDWAMAMGNPFVLAEDLKPTVTLGIVSGVNRYQYGQTEKLLVYGNCIQIDSSINPGNSGGPLFNMDGEVIGINGRGSFEERGRVNVGIGYAISAEQIKKFMPELLATKVAMHGTLDATFAQYSTGVLCNAIKESAPIYKLGLRLGDRLVEFEGKPVQSANQFTNDIVSLPAGWPVHLVVVDADGKRQEYWTRLLPVEYQAPKPKPEAKPKKGDEDDPRRIRMPRRQPVNFGKQGEVRDKKLNREAAEMVLRHWDAQRGSAGKKTKAFRWIENVYEGDKHVGKQRVIVTTDGRVRYEVLMAWSTDPEGTVHVTDDDALARWFSVAGNTVKRWKHIALDGSDKAQRQPAFRVELTDDAGAVSYAWFSVIDQHGELDARLLKTTLPSGMRWPGKAEQRDGMAVTFTKFAASAGVKLPTVRTHVAGIEERPILRFEADVIETLDKVDETWFTAAGEAKSEGKAGADGE